MRGTIIFIASEGRLKAILGVMKGSHRRAHPSDFYTKTEPAALRIFDTFGKTTFATLSANSGHHQVRASMQGKPKQVRAYETTSEPSTRGVVDIT